MKIVPGYLFCPTYSEGPESFFWALVVSTNVTNDRCHVLCSFQDQKLMILEQDVIAHLEVWTWVRIA